MKINIKGPEEYTVSQWAGGATTQLYIYPEHADYSRRDFIFRLSSATVECERSEFTSLPEVDRILMVLRGCASTAMGSKRCSPMSRPLLTAAGRPPAMAGPRIST